MIYQKNCKDNLRALFVEILVLLYRGQQTGFAFGFCPAKNWTQSQPTKTILLVYSHNPLLFCEDLSTSWYERRGRGAACSHCVPLSASFMLFPFILFTVSFVSCLCALMFEKCLRVKLNIGSTLGLYSILTSWLRFCFGLFLLTYDAVMLAKKKNVKSCIIYEICIKEKCNSIINKSLSSFGRNCWGFVSSGLFDNAEAEQMFTRSVQGLGHLISSPRLNASCTGHPERRRLWILFI